MYIFTINDIDIIPKQSIRFNIKQNRFYQPTKYTKYIKTIKQKLQSELPNTYDLYDLPVAVEYIAYFKTRNKKLIGRYKETTPDVDNILKPINDAVKGILIRDDKQIVSCSVSKYYSNCSKLIIKIRYIHNNYNNLNNI